MKGQFQVSDARQRPRVPLPATVLDGQQFQASTRLRRPVDNGPLFDYRDSVFDAVVAGRAITPPMRRRTDMYMWKIAHTAISGTVVTLPP